jgi:hypothetical protein
VTTVLLQGAGAVGARAARQLVETPSIDHVLIADRSAERAEAVAGVMGDKAEPIAWARDGIPELPDGVDAIASAVPAGADIGVARAAMAARVPLASAGDDVLGIQGMLSFEAMARDAGVTLAAGCGLAPGLADVLARHAADSFDVVDEINVARYGAAGDASHSTVRRALRERPVEVRDGRRTEARRRGARELIWFPDPVGAHECEVVGTAVDLLLRAFPDAQRVAVRQAEPDRRPRIALPGRNDPEGSWGALRVETWGRRGPGREPLVYGAVERTAIATGTVLAVTVAALAGALPSLVRAEPGVRGLGQIAAPRAFLEELARRGVRAAVFEGVPVA